MSTVKRIYRNMIFLSSAEVISKVLQFLLMIYAARILDRESFGKFNFALSLSFIAIVVADFGINTLLIREISRNRKGVGKYFVNSVALKIAMAFITFFAMILFLNAMDYPQDTKNIVYIIWVFTLVSTFTELFYSVFRAFESMIFDSAIKIARMIILSAAGIMVLLKYENVVMFSSVFVITEIIMFLLAYAVASKKFRVNNGRLEFNFMKRLLKAALPFALSFIFSTVYFFIGSVMLSKIKGDVEVAYFSAAYNIILAVLFIPLVYGNVIYPVMSRSFKKSKKDLKEIYFKSFKYFIIIGLPLSVGMFLLSKDIMHLFYGDKYVYSYVALQIISGYILIKFLNTLMGFVLSSIDRQGYRMVGQGATAAGIIILNLILIPRMGFLGAAIATFGAEAILFSMYYYCSSRFLCTYNPFPALAKCSVAAAFMVFAMIIVNWGIIFKAILGIIVYFSLIFLFKVFDKEDAAIINKILKK